jgi:hemolysin activation/secretion protein
MFGDRDFHPNINADDADLGGVAASVAVSRGVLATETRWYGEMKLEMAAGDFEYTRGMLEGSVSLPLPATLLVSFTASAGASGGRLPVQRMWILGGSRSLRGQTAGAMSGDAFWMTQTELATVNVFARPILFFDAAWAGDRHDFSKPGRIGSGAGLGISMFDGTLRFDLARGIFPGTGWRGMLYLQDRY